MGFFDLFRRPDINAGVEKFRSIPGAVLLDVRFSEDRISMPVWKNSGAYRGLYCWTCGMMQNSGEVIFREA